MQPHPLPCPSPSVDSAMAAIGELLPSTVKLRAELSAERWSVIEARAFERVEILVAVAQARTGGLSHRDALAGVKPDLHWSTYLNWWRSARDRPGLDWERQLDVRSPPPPRVVPEDVCAGACMLRRVSPSITCEEAQAHLLAQFGPERGSVSATSLKRIWKEAGLAQPRGGNRGEHARTSPEVVTRLAGGGGLALLAAAAAETGIVEELGAVAVARATEMAAQQAEIEPCELDLLRDERGRLTAAYNRAVRGGREVDPRMEPDAAKRERRSLHSLSLLKTSAGVVGRKVLAMGVSPLLTERRGFDGLEGPNGAWLAALGGHAYQDTTLDKCLSELALADVGEALWTAHAHQWHRVTAPWCAEKEQAEWLRYAAYIDATQDPYWTRRYAASGKVSRVGRVMPCLTRVAMMGGPGVPLLVETHAGSVSLKKELPAFLDRVDAAIGEGELGRLTIIDAEMATTQLLTALASRPNKWFITVLKGSTAKSAQLSDEQPWVSFRERDKLRNVKVRLGRPGKGAGELNLRGVEMVREGSRNPTSTLFVTDATEEELSLEDVAAAYLSRWPHQEQRFRDGRNGIGLDHTHGYGGHHVTHVALTTKLEKTERSTERAEAQLKIAVGVETRAKAQQESAAQGDRADARAALHTATRARRGAEKRVEDKKQELARLESTPKEIYVRDTTRDGIVTCAKLTVLMLIEFVLKEYFSNLRLEPRTFIELFVAVPVTIRESKHEVLYELAANPRSQAHTELLREACNEVTRRKLTVQRKRLRFAVIDAFDGLERRIER